MITISNYIDKSKGLKFDTEVLKKGHSFTIENIDLYGADADIDLVIDNHLNLVNEMEPKEKKKLSCPPLDKEGRRRIDDKGLELLSECIAQQPDTKEINSEGGNYTPDRIKLHNKIISDFKKDAPCITHKKPIAILTGGPPGSGKSHFLKTFAPWMNSKNIYHIDADAVRALLPEYKGWNADVTQPETSDIVKQMLESIGNPCEHDLIYDGTMNKAKRYEPLIEKLKSMGYKVFVIYLQVPKKVSVKRAMERYQRTGRYVPMKVIDEVFAAGKEPFETVIKMADGYIRVNGENGKIIEKGGEKIPTDRDYKFKRSEPKKKPSSAPASAPKKKTIKKQKTADQFIKDLEKQPGKLAKLTENQVIKVGLLFQNKYRSKRAQGDKTRDSKRRLSPTPTNLLRWMKNPGNFDLIGVDTFERTDQTADYKRLIYKQKFWNTFGIKYNEF